MVMQESDNQFRPDFDPNRRSSIDTLTMPELLAVVEADRPRDVALATRSLTNRIVETDRDTFGVNLQYQTQNFQLVLSGRRAAMELGRSLGSYETDLAKELKRSGQEISDVSQLLYWFGVFNKAGRSITGLANVFESMSTDTLLFPDVFKRVFNLPAVVEAESEHVMKRHLGNDIDKVIRACTVVGLCEDKVKMLDLMASPGWKLLFEDDEEAIRYVGNPSAWSNNRNEDSLETEKKTRGPLVLNGNLWARAETLDESEAFKATLTEMVGGNTLAVNLGIGLFKLFGMDSEYATAKINKKGKATVLLEGWPNSGDLSKMMHFTGWQTKQDAAGHPCGPKATRKQIDSLLLPFLKFISYKTDLKDEKSTRSFYELMWGYKDEEPALRLGEMDWGKLTPDVWNDWGTKIVVPGGEKGLFNLLKAEKTDSDAMTADSFWSFLRLNLNVAINQALMVRGEYKNANYREGDDERLKQKIVDIFWKGVKSLPDYHVWKNQPIDENSSNLQVLGLNKPTRKEDFIKRIAMNAGFKLS
jgi:hypothetical protein